MRHRRAKLVGIVQSGGQQREGNPRACQAGGCTIRVRVRVRTTREAHGRVNWVGSWEGLGSKGVEAVGGVEGHRGGRLAPRGGAGAGRCLAPRPPGGGRGLQTDRRRPVRGPPPAVREHMAVAVALNGRGAEPLRGRSAAVSRFGGGGGGEVRGDPAVQPLDPHLVPLLGREFGGGGLGSALG